MIIPQNKISSSLACFTIFAISRYHPQLLMVISCRAIFNLQFFLSGSLYRSRTTDEQRLSTNEFTDHFLGKHPPPLPIDRRRRLSVTMSPPKSITKLYSWARVIIREAVYIRVKRARAERFSLVNNDLQIINKYAQLLSTPGAQSSLCH